jgi:hypothetical protein
MEQAITAIEQAIRAMHETVTVAALAQAPREPAGAVTKLVSFLRHEPPALLDAESKLQLLTQRHSNRANDGARQDSSHVCQ